LKLEDIEIKKRGKPGCSRQGGRTRLGENDAPCGWIEEQGRRVLGGRSVFVRTEGARQSEKIDKRIPGRKGAVWGRQGDPWGSESDQGEGALP